jgi:hypothetical protein
VHHLDLTLDEGSLILICGTSTELPKEIPYGHA